MPVPSRTKAEVKYNVTTDFPQLGLHFAAATGNVGLVKYALSHGQPINSVLDGVLPIHAACSGGNDLVVRLLIDSGADVNAPRLPRRYSNDKHRDASAPIVGASGSTPLHFAAANGHAPVVATLLLHGAHAHRSDKHGITPEMLARQNGQIECADLLRLWQINKDRDLREREAVLGEHPPRSSSSIGDVFETPSRRRIHVKRSIDNAFNLFRSDSHIRPPPATSPPALLRTHPDQSRYISESSGEYSFYPVDTNQIPGVSERRPSLPHVDINVPPKTPSTSRPPPSPRRPRSAGTGAEPPPAPQPTHTRKLGTKYSWLHLFRKAHPTGEVSTSTAGSTIGPERPRDPPTSSPPSALPIPIPSTNSESKPPNTSPKTAPLSSSFGSSRHRYGVDASESSPRGTSSLTTVDIHRTVIQQHPSHSRGHSSSGFSTPEGVYENDVPAVADARGSNSSLPLGIHHPHTRSSSHTVKSTLRFDSTSSRAGSSRLRHDSTRTRSPAKRGLKGCSSAGSLVPSETGVGALRSPKKNVPESAPPGMFDFQDTDPDTPCAEDEEEYGLPMERPPFSPGPRELESPRLVALRNIGNRSVASFASSLEQHGSGPDDGHVDADVAAAPSRASDFPFSINHPPPLDLDDHNKLSAPASTLSSSPLPVSAHEKTPSLAVGSDNRARGDSVSSVSTDGSHNPQLSSSGTTATSGSSVTTPGIIAGASSYSTIHDPKGGDGEGFFSRPEGLLRVVDPTVGDGAGEFALLGHSPGLILNDRHLSIGERRSHTPLDIDIRSISSHAQAEALVQRTQRSILEMGNNEMLVHHDDDDQKPLSAGLIGVGWTPLSAKLAAYGESLAIERKLKMEEDVKRRLRRGDGHEVVGEEGKVDLSLKHGPLEGGKAKSRKAGLERQFSLEQRSTAGPHSRIHIPKRPNTSGGMNTDDPSSTHPTPERLQSRSASTSGGLVITSRVSSPLKLPVSLPSNEDDEHDDHCAHPVVRAHTPELDKPCSPTVTTDDENGSPLCRVSTAPDSICDRPRDDQARHVASVNKLTRMGFATGGDTRHGVAGRSTSPRPFAGGKARLKILMQTLKGKS